MKLSDKGWRKVVLAENLLDDPDFEQSDFEDAVVLTIKEAHRIRWAMNPSPEDCIWRDLLEERIEQAEKENEPN